MRIAINLISISGADSQAVYAHNIIKNLSKIVNTGELTVFISKNNQSIIEGVSNLEIRKYNIGDSWILRLFFINCILPIIFWLGKFDLLYTPNTIFPILLGSRNIITIHDLSYLKYKKYEPFFSGIFIRIMYKLANWSTAVIAISESVKSDILECLKIDSKKIKVILNGLPEYSNIFKNEKSTENISLDCEYIVYVGMSRKRKNLDNLLLALFNLDRVKLVIIGSAISSKKYFENKFSKEFIDKRIIFMGSVSESTKIKVIRNSMALVFPSLYEGFGFPLLEAQSLGVPVIASDIRIFREVGGESVLYFNQLDPGDISSKIKKIIENYDVRNTLIKSGSKNLSRFNWVDSSHKLYKLFIEKYHEKNPSR